MNEEKYVKKSKDKPLLPSINLKVDGQFAVLKSLSEWYGVNKKPVTYRDIGGVHASKTNVSSTLPFFLKVGWLEQEKRGQYTPSEDLIQYFEGFDQKSATKNLSNKILETPIGQKLLFFLNQKHKSKEEGLINYIGSELSLKKADKNRIVRLIEILINLGALVKHDDEIKIPNGKSKTTPQTIGQKIKKQLKTSMSSDPIIEIAPNIFFGVLINPDTNEEQIRKAVRTVFDEIKKVMSNEKE